MNLVELDWQIEPLHNIIVGLDAGLDVIRKRMDGEEGFDGISALEHADSLLGLGFVAAQAYIVGTWTDLNRIRNASGKLPVDKLQCYATDLITVKAVTRRIQIINAAANYFKHHDEWLRWPKNETTRILRAVGITNASEYPCVEATCLLCGDTWKLIVLHEIVREWRAHVLSALR